MNKAMNKAIALAAISAITTGFASAAVIVTNGDTYIRSSDETMNYNSDPYMVANNNGVNVRMAVFSFDISSETVGSITSAKLELDDVIGNVSQNYAIWGLLDAAEDFDETTLTWNNAGFLSGTTVDVSKAYGGAALGSFSNTANTVNTLFDVTSGTFLDFLNASGDNDVTFVVLDLGTAGGGSGWATKESSVDLKPTLTLTSIPEPSSAVLLGLGGLALILRRRR